MAYKIKKQDWKSILKTMVFYNRQSGFINVLDDKLTFFDTNAVIDGADSFYITKQEVEMYIKQY